MFNKEYVNINILDNCASVMDHNNGSSLVITTCTGSSDQKFTYDPVTHELKYNNKCLQSNNQNNIELWNCDNTNNQKWIYDKTTFQFKNMKNVNKCMDVPYSSIKNGTHIQLQDCVSNNNQKFYITNANDKLIIKESATFL